MRLNERMDIMSKLMNNVNSGINGVNNNIHSIDKKVILHEYICYHEPITHIDNLYVRIPY